MLARATAVAFLLAAATTTPAAADTGPHCGDTIKTSIRLTANLACHGTALIINPDFHPGPQPPRTRLKIDFAGHTIKGDGTGVGLAMGRDLKSMSSGVDLIDGGITDFASALISTGQHDPGPGDLSLTRMRIIRNGQWVGWGDNDDLHIRDSQFVDSGLGGPGTDSSMTVTNSDFVRTGLTAAFEGNTNIYNSRLVGGSIDARWLVAVGNTITSCGPGSLFGINAIGGSARIQGNTVSKCGVGIQVGPLERGATIEGNTLTHNAHEGLQVSTGLPWPAPPGMPTITIAGNLFSGNGGDGLSVTGDHPVTVEANTATKNAGHGMNLTGTNLTDGGGNTARKNGTDPQCVGLACS